MDVTDIRLECLRLANECGGDTAQVVERTKAYIDVVMDKPEAPPMDFRDELERFLVETGCDSTALGMALTGSRAYLNSLKTSSRPHPKTIHRARAQMAHYREHGVFMPRTNFRKPRVLRAAE